MFSKGKEVKKEQTQVVNSGQRNVLAGGTKITGDVKSEGDFRVDGTIDGTIETSGRVVIGQTGVIKGHLICSNAEVEGSVSGVIKVSELLSLKSTAKINGEVYVAKLAIEPGANFDATCNMSTNGSSSQKPKEAIKVEKATVK